MDMNEMRGKVLKVNLSRPMKEPLQLGGNRAIWESEEWLKQNVKPLAQSGGPFPWTLCHPTPSSRFIQACKDVKQELRHSKITHMKKTTTRMPCKNDLLRYLIHSDPRCPLGSVEQSRECVVV